ncbi:MAG TPA: hypothetical protein VHK69_14755, partial [Chitinophagaceae bacterium]|nr:hypothetical protein [Chitinophagaceae bacterium]
QRSKGTIEVLYLRPPFLLRSARNPVTIETDLPARKACRSTTNLKPQTQTPHSRFSTPRQTIFSLQSRFTYF